MSIKVVIASSCEILTVTGMDECGNGHLMVERKDGSTFNMPIDDLLVVERLSHVDLVEISGKHNPKCPYPGIHHESCTCEGMGGPR